MPPLSPLLKLLPVFCYHQKVSNSAQHFISNEAESHSTEPKNLLGKQAHIYDPLKERCLFLGANTLRSVHIVKWIGATRKRTILPKKEIITS